VEAIVMLVIQLIYQQVENYIVYPMVYRRAVELSPFTTIVAVLIAGSILGVVGAILAVPFAAVIKIVLREAGAPRRTQMESLRRSWAADHPAGVTPSHPEDRDPATHGSGRSA
jgi:predicted PurR-regulated permease PerM